MCANNSPKNAAVGPGHSRLRSWRSWGDRAMPVFKSRSRDERLAWLFRERTRSASTGLRDFSAPDGRPTLDEGHSDNSDRLLERLRAMRGRF